MGHSVKPNYWAVVAAVLAGLVVSAIWYSPLLFGKLWTELRDVAPAAADQAGMPAWKWPVEAVRELVVGYVLARLVLLGGIVDWKGSLKLGFWAWLGFPAAMLVGASLWDNKSWTLSAIHAGDWFVKMLVMAVIIGVWSSRRAPVAASRAAAVVPAEGSQR